jgi:Protein of unknown function (DUF2585)
MGIARRYWLGVFTVFAVTIGILVAMDRPPICTCGYVKIWEGVVNGPGNSQHIADWYTFSHITHGFIFFGFTWLLMQHRPLGRRLIVASVIEMLWELVENSPAIIDRYRDATAAVGYSGDSILNSVADGGWMMLGFLVASRLPWKATLGIAITFELFTLFMIRDNLTLNIVMLVSPIDAIRVWQAAG